MATNLVPIWLPFLLAFMFGFSTGKLHLKGKIVNGSPVHIDNYPFFVTIEYYLHNLQEYQHLCGGSLVTTKHVLTAAHCTMTDYRTMRVQAGLDDVRNVAEVESRTVAGFMWFPNFTIVKNVPVNDIAFLILSSPFDLSSRIQIVAIPEQNAEPLCCTATLIGFGSTKTDDPPVPSDVLLKVNIPLISNAKCQKALERIAPADFGTIPLQDNNICTKSPPPTKGGCHGDSGGPLIQDDKIIGVVSWGSSPCEKNSPTVYSKVSSYTDWLIWHIYYNP